MAENTTDNKGTHRSETDLCPLPNLCDVRNLFVLVLLTEVLALVFTLVSATSEIQFWDTLSLTSLLMLWIALLNAALLCTLRPILQRLSTNLCLTLSFGLMMAVSLLVSLLISEAGTLFIAFLDETSIDSLFIIRVMLISALLYFLLLRYFYIQLQWRINLDAQSRAEVQALRARIRPHFLFNSMNTIASLIEVAPDKAETAIEDLSDLFRASLDEHNMNPLREEISLTKSYLAIESLRLGNRLQIGWQIDSDCLDIKVPSLSLQPLVENAIYHGIEPMEKGGKIEISALQIDNSLKLSISNPLSAENAAATRKKGNQMAQDNIRQRLRLVYGKRSKFSINDTKEKYTVSLLIPLDVIHERTDR